MWAYEFVGNLLICARGAQQEPVAMPLHDDLVREKGIPVLLVAPNSRALQNARRVFARLSVPARAMVAVA